MTRIDYYKISEAVSHYIARGYKYIEVPWLVSNSADMATKPDCFSSLECSWTKPKYHYTGNLVASGEQSFIQMMIDRQLPPDKYVCVTPCFRDEQPVTDLNRSYFMKVELIDTRPANHSIENMVSDALAFYNRFLIAMPISTNEGFDIVSDEKEIELGSYGIRSYGNHQWIYGSGCAEPRLSQAIELERVSFI